MQTLTQRRSVPVDAAKTAAIFGTLLIHASAAGGFAGAPGSFGWTSALFWNCLLRSAVPVFFLCSGMSPWVTGSALVVDGGGIA